MEVDNLAKQTMAKFYYRERLNPVRIHTHKNSIVCFACNSLEQKTFIFQIRPPNAAFSTQMPVNGLMIDCIIFSAQVIRFFQCRKERKKKTKQKQANINIKHKICANEIIPQCSHMPTEAKNGAYYKLKAIFFSLYIYKNKKNHNCNYPMSCS